MDQKILIGIIIGIFIGVIGGYVGARMVNPAPATTAANPPPQQAQQAQTTVQAAGSVQTNPYQNVKTNPFE